VFFIKILPSKMEGVDIPTVVPRMSYSSGSVSIVGIQLTKPRKSIESSSVDRPKNGEMRHTRESYFGWAMIRIEFNSRHSADWVREFIENPKNGPCTSGSLCSCRQKHRFLKNGECISRPRADETRIHEKADDLLIIGLKSRIPFE
jgi:hypothetical protein